MGFLMLMLSLAQTADTLQSFSGRATSRLSKYYRIKWSSDNSKSHFAEFVTPKRKYILSFKAAPFPPMILYGKYGFWPSVHHVTDLEEAVIT